MNVKKILILMAISAFCGSSYAANRPDADFDKALTRYAQSSAREMMTGLISQYGDGTSWKIILGQNLPKLIDDRCGYREKLSLPNEGFMQMRDAIMPVAGERFNKAFSTMLSRPGAKLDLVNIKPLEYNGARQALVVTRVIPAKPGDTPIGLLYQLDGGGRMSLCDVTNGSSVDKGILSSLAKDLGR